MSLRQFPTRHPWLWTLLSFLVVWFPAWIQSIWGLWSSEPLVPLVLDKLRKVELPTFSAYWVSIPVGAAMFGWLLYQQRSRNADRTHFASAEGEDEGFVEGFNRATFARNPDLKGAKLRLSQLRGEGVVIRNAGATLMFTSHLDAWAKKVSEWMREAIAAIRVIDEADSEWFATLGEVPAARVPISNVQLGGQFDREMFVKLFREHDFRLARLDQLFKKYGIGG